jgi:hypothetical protein
MTDSPRILTFAGQSVPEDGLTVVPPQGGELTIWPDGGYAFTPPASGVFSDGQEPLTTYYSYDIEDIDGTVATGTFAFDPDETPPALMHDFQAWSLPDLLDGDGFATLGVGFEDFGPAVVDEAVASPDVPSPDPALAVSGTVYEDDVALLLLASQHG